MKKAMLVLFIGMMSWNVQAQIKCQPSPSGGVCCWDVVKDGPFRPIGC